MNEVFRAGTVAIVGRPNVGKSTLLNRLVGQKVSITSRKPQTTRHRVLGIHTQAQFQAVFVDTPGFQTRHGGRLNAALNRSVRTALADTDAVILVLEVGRYGREDRQVAELLPENKPLILALNKLDRVKERAALLPFLQEMQAAFPAAALVPVSAQQGTGVAELYRVLAERLPEGPPLYGEDEVTDQSERRLAAEFIREKLFRLCGEEIPYGTAVAIDKFESEGDLRRIYATILVDKESHKAIVIGQGGEKLKAISSQARQDMEKTFGARVYLETWVKVKGGWAEDRRMLRELGLE